MASHTEALYAFNRGIVSALAVARLDVKRIALSAEQQTNFLPLVLGPMSLRPGLKYLGASYSSTRYIPFVFAIDDTALIEISSGQLRVWVNDALITRASVSTTIADSGFTSLAGWTDSDESGGVSTNLTVGASVYLTLTGTGTNAAIRAQTLTVAAGDINVRHAFRITVVSGDLTIKVGTTSGASDILAETTLSEGVHSITWTPTQATMYLQLLNRAAEPTWVDSITVESGGTLTLPVSWTTVTHLNDIRYEQSADVVYFACSGVEQVKTERRSNDSWSVVRYIPDDGPFRASNTSSLTLTPSALTGSGTLTASRALFNANHVGALFKLVATGQTVTTTLGSLNAVTEPVRISGVGTDRALLREITGTGWTGTITLQRSIGEIGLWTDVTTVVDGTASYNDGLDNQIIYYRLKITAYTAGSTATVLTYPLGSTTGTCRIYAFTSSTVVSVNIIAPFGSITATDDWAEGEWSTHRGYPSAVALHEGRLSWAGKEKHWASVSDAYSTFDDETEGDSGPISRSIGTGPIDKIRWLIAAVRLVIGGQAAERTVRSSQLDEPITPTNYNLKTYSTRGSGSVSGVVVDKSILFVDRSERRVFDLSHEGSGDGNLVEMTALAPKVCDGGVTRMVVQRQPDTRIHCVLDDGTVALLVYDVLEEVKSWVKVETDGLIIDAAVLPGTGGEDQVYYVVMRTIGGSPAYYLEKWALASECVGGTLNNQADSFVSYTGASTTSITGLTHLNGESVVCWADGADKGTFTVSGGAITLTTAATNAVVGLTYRARFKSTKLGYNVQGQPALTNHKERRVHHVGLLLADTHYQGLTYGTDFDNMDALPLYDEGALTAADTVHATYDGDPVEVNGTLSNDTRLCLEANAPRPCTVLAAVIELSDN